MLQSSFMDLLVHILEDSLIDTLRLIPFLFVTYLIMEAIEHKMEGRAEQAVQRAGFAGPIVGALMGAFPQCGFSAAAATLYAGRVITLGTLFAVFLATSDELLPILIAEQAPISMMVQILGTKVLIGMVMGFIVDAFMRITARHHRHLHIHDLCEHDHCDCDDGIVKSALKHTLQVTVFIFLISLIVTGAIELVGEDALAAFLASQPVLSVAASAVVGLIPNCAASVIITELYLEGALSAGSMMSGLLVSAGVGFLVLYRTNRPIRSTLGIVGMLLVIGVAWGFIIDACGIVF